MRNMINQEINVGDFVFFTNYHNNFIGKIINSIGTDRVECISTYSGNYTMLMSINGVININDLIHNMNNGDEIIIKINANVAQYANKLLLYQKAKQDKLAQKQLLQKSSKPGMIYNGNGYNNYYIYLGLDSDNKHTYIHFRRYHQSGVEYYGFMLYKNKFIQKLKTKRLPSSVFSDEVNITTMFERLKTTIEATSRVVRSPATDLTLADVTEMENMYNTQGK